VKYALVDGTRQEAQPKLRGVCVNCEREVLAKCGRQRIWHWSHRGKLECDNWWEPETEWHRSWKAHFPREWQEVVHTADNGEKHIADLKTSRGQVVEFQHSPISPDERNSREGFYSPMVWVVDGNRYKRDLTVFREAIEHGTIIQDAPLYIRPARRDAAIFRRWSPLQCAVFLDFGSEEFSIAGFPLTVSVLWLLQLDRTTGQVVVSAVTRESFIHFCMTGENWQALTVMRSQPSYSLYRRPQSRGYRSQRRRL
jgi:competence protein CoiA